jgi:hypothetical protein
MGGQRNRVAQLVQSLRFLGIERGATPQLERNRAQPDAEAVPLALIELYPSVI